MKSINAVVTMKVIFYLLLLVGIVKSYLICQQKRETFYCLKNEKLTWNEADEFCKANKMQMVQEINQDVAYFFSRVILKLNGITNLWTKITPNEIKSLHFEIAEEEPPNSLPYCYINSFNGTWHHASKFDTFSPFCEVGYKDYMIELLKKTKKYHVASKGETKMLSDFIIVKN